MFLLFSSLRRTCEGKGGLPKPHPSTPAGEARTGFQRAGLLQSLILAASGHALLIVGGAYRKELADGYLRFESALERRSGFQLERMALLDSVFPALMRGERIGMGEFILKANEIDSREDGRTFDIGRAIERYNRYGAQLTERLRNGERIQEAVPEVFRELVYVRDGGRMADAVFTQTANCDQVSQLIASTLNDSGFAAQTFLRSYSDHIAPIYLDHGGEFDLMAGRVSDSRGRRFPARDLVDAYAIQHGLSRPMYHDLRWIPEMAGLLLRMIRRQPTITILHGIRPSGFEYLPSTEPSNLGDNNFAQRAVRSYSPASQSENRIHGQHQVDGHGHRIIYNRRHYRRPTTFNDLVSRLDLISESVGGVPRQSILRHQGQNEPIEIEILEQAVHSADSRHLAPRPHITSQYEAAYLIDSIRDNIEQNMELLENETDDGWRLVGYAFQAANYAIGSLLLHDLERNEESEGYRMRREVISENARRIIANLPEDRRRAIFRNQGFSPFIAWLGPFGRDMLFHELGRVVGGIHGTTWWAPLVAYAPAREQAFREVERMGRERGRLDVIAVLDDAINGGIDLPETAPYGQAYQVMQRVYAYYDTLRNENGVKISFSDIERICREESARRGLGQEWASSMIFYFSIREQDIRARPSADEFLGWLSTPATLAISERFRNDASTRLEDIIRLPATRLPETVNEMLRIPLTGRR